MAVRGARPKPAHLRIIDGTHRKDRHGEKPAPNETPSSGPDSMFGPLSRPRGLKGEALKAWKRFIEPCTWLDALAEPSALMFCELYAEFRESPRSFNAHRYAQMRHLQSELGLTDPRKRGGDSSEQAKDEFFGD
jgi:hypothetical protein